ncbi:flagellar protein MotY [Sulfuriflexus sp.]|uniref:flagellar protein MotY n=1 Tax=Sulfuriflexus sp. TaxID=2015443 RepID=UPI0028CF1334|nr:OmpA family protein [Sulfuriflexus sp.]MDT8403892.1 OmpA family protein [Sulfuriflexus sp.]
MSSLLIRIVFFISAGFLSSAAMANTLHYEAPLHQASWQAQGSPLVCRLSHEIGFYGSAEFVRYAGRQMYLSVNVDQGGPRDGKARLRARPAAWQHGLAEQNLGAVAYRGGRDPFRFSRKQVKRILASLEQGMRPALYYHSGADGIEVVLSSMKFRDGLADFRRCMASLIPVDYASASDSRILFGIGDTLLDKQAKYRLDAIAAFVVSDPDIKQVEIQGYSDNVGTRGDNYALSRQRAVAVREYLLGRKVPAEMIKFDYYGEHKPLKSNRSAAGRAANRRVEVKLQK